MLLVGIFSAYILYKNARPSRGVPYEEATTSQVIEYMTYEKGYALIDVSDPEIFAENHMEGAENLPYAALIEQSALRLPNKDQMIYIYGTDPDDARKAAIKLCELGYTSITLIKDAE